MTCDERRCVRLSEGERVRLDSRLEERELECLLVDRSVLAHQLVQAALPEHTGPVLVDVDTV